VKQRDRIHSPGKESVMHVVVDPKISKRLGELIANNREVLLMVLNRLHDQLGNHAERYRGRRDPEDPDLFDYVHALYVDGKWYRFRFSVNDAKATDHLFVEAVSMS
jgi:hypothetical protein